MAVLGVFGVTLEVPEVAVGIGFYTSAGLVADIAEDSAALFCPGSQTPCVTLVQGGPQMRLHHVALRANALDDIALGVPAHGGKVVEAPAGFAAEGLWVRDPHDVLFHLVDREPDPVLPVPHRFAINAPGDIVRNRRSAMAPVNSYAPPQPRKLGHVALFTPDVMASVAFLTDAFGMGLADRAQDIVAFCCARQNSDHHVIALAKSPGIGLHHASFQVADPDEVGRAGQALATAAGRGHWGVGRHTIGSNFFHYIQDPWGSWFEYYADMDFIDDHVLWQPTVYGMEDAMANWGPPVPSDFVHNYQAEGGQ
jgi:catechol 2,3-dioxygenase